MDRVQLEVWPHLVGLLGGGELGGTLACALGTRVGGGRGAGERADVVHYSRAERQGRRSSRRARKTFPVKVDFF